MAGKRGRKRVGKKVRAAGAKRSSRKKRTPPKRSRSGPRTARKKNGGRVVPPSAAVAPRSLAAAAVSKPVAVSRAVSSQLTQEGKWPPNDVTKIMGADYRYSLASMENFLVAVSLALEQGVPPYRFRFDGPFAAGALALDVARLTGLITARTAAV